MHRRGLLAACGPAGCGPAGCGVVDVALPPDPPGVGTPDEYPFGSAVAQRDWRALSRVLDQLEPLYGRVNQGRLRVHPRTLAAGGDPDAVRRHYARALAPLGLEPTTLDAPVGAWATAFAQAVPGWQFWRDGLMFAAVAILPQAAGDSVPLNLVTNLGRG